MNQENTMKTYRVGLNIECMIDDVDVGASITSITITRTLSIPFSHFKISLLVNPELLRFIRDIFSIEPTIKLTLRNSIEDNPNNQTHDIKTYKLLIITDISIISQILQDIQINSSLDAQSITLDALPYDAVKIASETVNKIYTNKRLEDIIHDNFNKVSIETPFKNTDKIEQLVIPPMNKSKMIYYLDYYFGYTNSGTVYWFNDDDESRKENDLIMFSPKELSDYKLELLGVVHGNANEQVDVDLKSGDGKIKIHPVDAKLLFDDTRLRDSLLHSFRYVFVKHPEEQLYQLYQSNIEKLINKDTLVDKKFKRTLPKDFHNNYNFYSTHSGLKTSNIPYDNWFCNTADLFNISTTLHGFVDTSLLIPGKLINWKPKDINYLKYQGKFMMTTIIVTYRGHQYATWGQTTEIVMARSNAQYLEEEKTSTAENIRMA